MMAGNGSGFAGAPLTVLSTVDSSNNYAMDAIHAGTAGHGASFFALEQTHGRGQRGKAWITEPGQNIILSLIIEPARIPIDNPFTLNMIFALAAQELFEQYAKTDTSIKWPNDIYWRDRKAAGMLVENVFRGSEWTFSVLGLGMNINQVGFPPEAKNPVSLKQVTGKEFDPIELVYSFFRILENQFSLYVTEGPQKIHAGYNARLFRKNELIRLKKEEKVMELRLQGVKETGELYVEEGLAFKNGEVEWMV